jgi:hypothetical protein
LAFAPYHGRRQDPPQLLDDEALLSDVFEPEPEFELEPESDFEDDDDPPSELELLLESDEDEEDSLLLEELSLASFISRERLRVP